MRFKEFNTIKEASGLDAISQISSIANTILNPFGDIGSISGEPSTNQSSSGLSKNIDIGKGAKGSISASEVSSYLKSKMDDNHRLGILANIQGESGFRPGIIGDNNTSGGLFQHHAERFTNMVGAVGSDWATDWKGQIDFALSEPEGREYLSSKFNSPEDATEWWVKHFERPKYAAQDTAKRIDMLKNFS